jgi:hypothetical protein
VNSWIRHKSAAVAKKIKEGREGDFSAPPPRPTPRAPPRDDEDSGSGLAAKAPAVRAAGRRRDKVSRATHKKTCKGRIILFF